MRIRFEEDVVLAKAASVRKCVAAIRALAEPERAGLEEWIRFDVTVLNLQRAIEALLDLANHVISANGWELPRDARHSFMLLVEHGVLPEARLPVAHAMVGFRNLAVHDYARLDPRVIQGIARERLTDLEAIVDEILGRLRG